jgi:hypothetical protein
VFKVYIFSLSSFIDVPLLPILVDVCVPTGATYEEVTGALENCCGDHRLEAVFHSQLNRRTQLVVESLQEFAATIYHLGHCTHIELPKHLKKPPMHSPTE